MGKRARSTKYVRRSIKRRSLYGPRRKFAGRTRRLGSKYVPSGMPKQRVAKLRYVESISRTTTSGVLDNYVFRANSCFDPDFTGTGHQPMGFDQWSALFNHYTVLGSKISVTAQIVTNASTKPVIAGVYLSDGSGAPYTLFTEFAEAKKGRWRQMLPSIGEKSYKLVSKFSAKKFYGLKDVMDNQNLRAAVTTNPGEDAFYHLWCQCADAASTATVRYTIVIDYIVKFTEPKDLAQS